MSFYEYIFSGILTPEYEEKTNELLKDINRQYVPYVIHKYIDEEIDDEKKNRTIIIHSHLNITSQLSYKFINCKLDMRVYLKQQII